MPAKAATGARDVAAPAVDKQVFVSVQGRPIHMAALGDGLDEIVLVVATIHGDEPAGAPLVERLGEHLLRHTELLAGRTVKLVPIANPDGLAAKTRENANGVDLNRNFPHRWEPGKTHGAGPLSEPEAGALYSLLHAGTEQVTRLITIHQPYGLVDWDGSAEALAAHVASKGDLPLQRLGARSGSLGSWGEELDRAVVTIELKGPDSRLSADELWSKYGEMLIAAIVFDPAAKPPGVDPSAKPAAP
jgi:protein MpaA